ncbi:hypothetical protein Trydic_g15528 [Trypoxylus dichotomus]
MEKEFYRWLLSQRERHANAPATVLKEEIIQIDTKYYNDNKFIASKGWLNRFEESQGIRRLEVSGEKLSSNPREERKEWTHLSYSLTRYTMMTNQHYFGSYCQLIH